MRFRLLREQWFLVGVAGVAALALWNPSRLIETAGPFLRHIHAHEWGLALIFVLAGLELHMSHIREAMRDWSGVAVSMTATFIVAPLIAFLLARLAPSTDIALGLFILGVVSTTQASGIVMTAAAGGKPAHALLICVLSNMLCIFTIPVQLQWLMGGHTLQVQIPWIPTTLKLGSLILLPLFAGMALRQPLAHTLAKLPFRLNVPSRLLILVFIFMGLCEGRASLLGHGSQLGSALALGVSFHLILAAIVWIALLAMGRGAGNRESVFFMGIQKTLPQAIWLQTTYFPAAAMALVVCILYHVSQLIMDSWLVGRFAKSNQKST